MAKFVPKRRHLYSFSSSSLASLIRGFCSEATASSGDRMASIFSNKHADPANRFCRVRLPMVPSMDRAEERFDVELMDPELWRVSFGLAHPCRDPPRFLEEDDAAAAGVLAADDLSDDVAAGPSFDEIEDLKLHKMLFYKLDRGSKEFEEYNINFRRRKKAPENVQKKPMQAASKECRKSEKRTLVDASSRAANIARKKKERDVSRDRSSPIRIKEIPGECLQQKSQAFAGGESFQAEARMEKKVRSPTFNQLTDPYHLPFCLDIHITKGSVRACIVHRLTSKVVAVAHSISKDIRFDLTCRRDSNACIAVGRVLAQRALEDDIYNVVYTPRKGDKIEGKLQLVVQSIIDHGVDIKVKLKQKRWGALLPKVQASSIAPVLEDQSLSSTSLCAE